MDMSLYVMRNGLVLILSYQIADSYNCLDYTSSGRDISSWQGRTGWSLGFWGASVCVKKAQLPVER